MLIAFLLTKVLLESLNIGLINIAKPKASVAKSLGTVGWTPTSCRDC